MMETPQTEGLYDFGEFRLDVRNRLLWRDGERVALTLKEFEVLLFLVENAGQVVGKTELLDAVWKDVFIEEGTLTRTVSRLRKKLEDGSRSEKIIETLPKRGYRFLPAVVKNGGGASVVEAESLARLSVAETAQSSNEIFRTNEARDIERTQQEIISPNLNSGLQQQPESSAKLAPALISPHAPTSRKLLLIAALGILCLAAIAFAAYRFSFRKSDPAAILAQRVVPFSGLPGREDFPAFSPDGKQIVFSWDGGSDDAHVWDIYVRLLGAGEPLRLTRGDRDAMFPVFSPDGKQIAFSRSMPDHSEMFLVSALGGAERKVADVHSRGSSFSFSPDGRFLAVPDTDATSSANGIFLLNVLTGAKQRVTTPPENMFDLTPRVSRDGRQIAFLRAANPWDMNIFIVPTEGGAARQLTFDRVGIEGLDWSADGATLVFASTRDKTSAANLWQIPAFGGEPRLIVTGGKNPINPTLAPDGKTIAFVEASEDINIWRYATTPDGKWSSAYKFIASARNEHSQQLSPNGQRIVFSSDRTGSSQIWVANADGSNQVQLTNLKSAGSPRFSPDGRFIAFDSNTQGTGDIFVINSDGTGNPRRLTDNRAHDVIPAWSADGNWIYFTSNRTGDLQIWKMPANGGNAMQITQQGGLEAFAAPDGKTIFYSKERGVAGVWSVPADGGAESPVPELAQAGYWRSWTVTNRGVYFVAYSPAAPYGIKLFDFATGQTADILPLDKIPLWQFAGLTVAPDGRTLLYAQHDQIASSIMLAELDTATQR